jgi:multidrug efflux pump subunit AcrA (membrane-fusion protein)
LFDAEQALINLGLPIDTDKLHSLPDDQLLSYLKFLGIPQSVMQKLDPKRATANLLPLFAPFGGVVIGQEIVIGEVVSPLEGGFEIADVSRMHLHLSVREEDSLMLRLGQPVIFEAGGIAVNTSISWISTEVDPKSRTIEARCDTENPFLVDAQSHKAIEQRALRANMFGIAKIQVQQKDQAIVVPSQAIQWAGNKNVVFVETEDNVFEVRHVDVGIATAELTEVIKGVKLGERVANEGSHVLKSEAARKWPSGGA